MEQRFCEVVCVIKILQERETFKSKETTHQFQ